MADPPQKFPGAGKTPPKAPAIIAAAVLIAAPLAAHFEGYRAKPYLDPASIRTVCYGETEGVEDRIYSKDECAAQLRSRMAHDYAPKVLTCLPQLGDINRRYVFGALLDASYNAGPVAVCKSRMAVAIRAGDWLGACRAFLGWYTTAKDRKTGVRRELPGLVTRRKAEAKTCATVPTPAAPVIAVAAPAPLPAPAAQPAPPPKLTLWQRIERFFGRKP